MKPRVVSTRLTIIELAKCRDGIITRGIDPSQLSTVSQILRSAVYLAIANCEEPTNIPSEESLNFINQLFNQTKMTKKPLDE